MTYNGRILLFGGSGQLGTAVRRLHPDVVAPSSREVDLASIRASDIEDLIQQHQPHLVINCAAYTKVDQAEEEEALATKVNGDAIGLLAEVTSTRSLPFVTFSTDYVFGGNVNRPYREEDPPQPVNAYGRSKVVGERLALAANPRSLVIRTSWLISGSHPNFVATILRRARSGTRLQVVDDQHGCPTVADDLATATLKAVAARSEGLLHLVNQEATTWFELAQEAVRLAGFDLGLVSPCGSADYPTAATRPRYSVMATDRARALGIQLPSWKDSLPNVVTELLGWV